MTSLWVEKNYFEEHLQNYQYYLLVGTNGLQWTLNFMDTSWAPIKQGTLHTRPAEFIGHPRCLESWHFDIVVPAVTYSKTSRYPHISCRSTQFAHTHIISWEMKTCTCKLAGLVSWKIWWYSHKLGFWITNNSLWNGYMCILLRKKHHTLIIKRSSPSCPIYMHTYTHMCVLIPPHPLTFSLNCASLCNFIGYWYNITIFMMQHKP